MEVVHNDLEQLLAELDKLRAHVADGSAHSFVMVAHIVPPGADAHDDKVQHGITAITHVCHHDRIEFLNVLLRVYSQATGMRLAALPTPDQLLSAIEGDIHAAAKGTKH